MQIEIRKATIADADDIGSVHYQAWIETYTGLINADFLANRSPSRSSELFRQNRCQNITVATVDGKIVGFCGYGAPRDSDIPNDWGELYGIYVLRQYQHISLGKRLISRAKSELHAQRYKRMFLWVLNSNQNAIAFYEKNGFLFDGKEKTERYITPIVEKRYICTL